MTPDEAEKVLRALPDISEKDHFGGAEALGGGDADGACGEEKVTTREVRGVGFCAVYKVACLSTFCCPS